MLLLNEYLHGQILYTVRRVVALLGCLACKIHHGSECTCCFNRLLCQCQECFDDRLMSYSVVIALCILVLELVFDWHRYQHVIKMTEMSGLYNRSSLFKNK